MLVVRRLRSPAALLAFSVFNNHKNIVAWTPTAFANFALGAAAAATTATESSTGRLFSSSAMSSADGTCAAKSESKFTVVQFPCLGDNYGYLIHDEATKHTAAIDTPDAKAYQDELAKRGWRLTHILNTHHHWDHTGGNLDLKTEGVSVYGPATEDIPGVDVGLKGEDEIEFGSSKARIIDVGGHTKGHIAYYFGDESKVFVGDSLFALGCGKMFEGTPAQFWASLLRLRDLPDDTLVYCAHEYTASNAKFAVSVEPGNAALMARVAEVNSARQRSEPTVPSLLGEEKKTNPFLRCDISEELRRNVGVADGDSDADAFAKVRKAKDNFRG